jgi:hypothetical protein
MDRTLVREAAIRNRVCIRPVVARVTQVETRETRLVAVPCGSTRERQCPPCADRARRLRMHQCREGWHLEDEPPECPPPPAGDDEQDDTDTDGEAAGSEASRRVRSTRRRDDVAELPRLPVENRTVGRVFEASDGKRWRPSTFITLTLGSYGKVTSHGVPVDPDSYDYRRAALDAIHFAKLVDRFWQNLRRAVGWKVQYFATIEGQRRLAPHLHAAARGALRRPMSTSGGHPTRPRSTSTSHRSGTPTVAATSTPTPASRSRGGPKRSMSWTRTLTPSLVMWCGSVPSRRMCKASSPAPRKRTG